MRHSTISDLIKDYNYPQDFTVGGECSGCGECCADLLPLTDKEIKHIKAYVKAHSIPEQNNVPVVALGAYDFTCPFRDNKNKCCTIYEIRPLICREYRCDYKTGEISKAMLNADVRLVSLRSVIYDNNTSLELISELASKGIYLR